jgi:hypothetical protein
LQRREFITLLGGAAFVQCSGWLGSRWANRAFKDGALTRG